MDSLTLLMSTEELVAFGKQHSDNEGIQTIVANALQSRENTELESALEAEFIEKVEELVYALPLPPARIWNVVARYADVEIEDITKEKVEVDIIDSQAILNEDGKIVTPAVSHKENRYPVMIAKQWIVKANGITSTDSGVEVKACKRAVTVRKHNPEGKDMPIGNFTSCQAACNFLELATGTTSARKILVDNGFYAEDYDGTDYTSK